MAGYQPSMGHNFAIKVRAQEVFIDDFTYNSTGLSIEDASLSLFTLWPNPVGPVLNVSSPEVLDAVSVYDMNGRLLLDLSSADVDGGVDVSTLSSGMYLIEVKSAGSTQIKKFLKQ
jgi:hypothetical protein